MKFQQKIMLVITKSNWGGAQKYVYEEALSNLDKGSEVIVIAGGEGELKHKLQYTDVRYINIPELERDISILKEFKVFFKLVKLFRKEKPTVIHLNSSKIGGLGSLAGRISNIFSKRSEIIFTAHGWAFNEDRSHISKLMITVLSYITTLLSHKVYVLSEYEKKQITKFPLVSNKVEITKLELSHIPFLPRENAKDFFRKNLSIKDTEWLVTIAELHKNKGLEYGIEAVKDLKKDFIWIIIGDGEEKYRLQELVEKYDLKEKVIIYGYLQDASKYLRAFDLFILPSIKEGLPYVLLEAKQAKLPIIATRVGGIPEYFSTDNNLIIKPKDVKSLHNALEQMI